MLYDLESHAKDGRCGLSRNEDIRRYIGKLVEKQTVDLRHFPSTYHQGSAQLRKYTIKNFSEKFDLKK